MIVRRTTLGPGPALAVIRPAPRVIRTPAPDPTPTVRRVVLAAAAVFGVLDEDIYGPDLHVPIPRARHAAWWLCRREASMSYPQIGRAFGRNHSSIVTGVVRLERRLAAGERLRLEPGGPRVPLSTLLERIAASARSAAPATTPEMNDDD